MPERGVAVVDEAGQMIPDGWPRHQMPSLTIGSRKTPVAGESLMSGTLPLDDLAVCHLVFAIRILSLKPCW